MDWFSCCTFNILAPCYRRIQKGLESSDIKGWRTRNESIFKLLLSLKCDVICLQEVWFEPAFQHELRQALGSEFSIHMMQRPRKHDGVAILVRGSKFDVLSTHQKAFKCVGQRVGLAARIRRKGTSEEILVGNTHLTFPHHMFDYKLRADQIRKFSSFLLDVRARTAPTAELVLCGDFNLCTRPELDNVCQHLQELGMRSAHFEARGRDPGVTHLTHANESHCVDFVFFAASKRMGVRNSFVYPAQLDDEKWHPEFTLSDHRPVLATFVFEDNSDTTPHHSDSSSSSPVSSSSSPTASSSSSSSSSPVGSPAVESDSRGESRGDKATDTESKPFNTRPSL